jgi:hypothetical protein
VWDVVQGASGTDEAVSVVRRKKVELDTARSQAGFVGYATSWAIRAVWLHEAAQETAQGVPVVGNEGPQGLPWDEVQEDGGGFLAWAYERMQAYLKERKEATFSEVMETKGHKITKLLAKWAAAEAA